MLDPSGWQLLCTQGNYVLVFALVWEACWAFITSPNSCNSVQGRACWEFVWVTFGEITRIVRAVTQSLENTREDLDSRPSFSDRNGHLSTIDCVMSFGLDDFQVPSLPTLKCLEICELLGYKCNLVQSLKLETEEHRKQVGNEIWPMSPKGSGFCESAWEKATAWRKSCGMGERLAGVARKLNLEPGLMETKPKFSKLLAA